MIWISLACHLALTFLNLQHFHPNWIITHEQADVHIKRCCITWKNVGHLNILRMKKHPCFTISLTRFFKCTYLRMASCMQNINFIWFSKRWAFTTKIFKKNATSVCLYYIFIIATFDYRKIVPSFDLWWQV